MNVCMYVCMYVRTYMCMFVCMYTAKTSELHTAIDDLDDPATQMVLRGSCADVVKVTYLLRLNGDKFIDSELEALGKTQREGVATTLEGEIGDLAWSQATEQTKRGGLGLRSAAELAFPAFIASRPASRPGAKQLFGRLEEAGLASQQSMIQAYDRKTDQAVARWTDS